MKKPFVPAGIQETYYQRTPGRIEKKNNKSVAYSSQGGHPGQLDS